MTDDQHFYILKSTGSGPRTRTSGCPLSPRLSERSGTLGLRLSLHPHYAMFLEVHALVPDWVALKVK